MGYGSLTMPPQFPLRALATSLALLLAPMAMAQLYTEHATLRGDPVSDQSFGLQVAASGDTIVAGTPGAPRNPKSAFVFVRGASGWTLQQKLPLSWTAVAIDGDTLVSGDTIYTRAGGTWTAQTVMQVQHPEVAMQRDTIVAGYPFDPTQARGAVLVYARGGSGWTQQAFLRPDTVAANSFLGSSVALDGDTLAGGTSNGGDAYIYIRTGTTWTLQQRLTVGTGFVSVALEGDTLAVGDEANSRVVIFNRSGSTWTQVQILTQPGTGDGSFGASIALNGGLLAVPVRGVFYVYARTSSGWVLGQTLTKPGYGLGIKTALANHGKLLVMGNPADGTSGTYSGIVEAYSVPPPPAPGSGWADADVGAVGVAGDSNASGGIVTVRGGGADIWDRADAFHFRSETLTGDGAIVARVTSTGGGQPWSKIGLMFREDVAAAARNVMTLVTPGNHIGMQARPDTADTTTFQDGGWSGTPIWLMLARSGNNFGSYRSDDGSNWTLMSTTTVVMPATVHVGLAVSSHDNAALNTGAFDGVQVVSAGPPPAPPAAPTNLSGSLAGAVDVQLSWTDNAVDETGFSIERSAGNGGGTYAVVGTVAANTSSFTDHNLAQNTAYTYRVQAVRGSAGSAYSNTFTITTQSAPPADLTGTAIGPGVSGAFTVVGDSTVINASSGDYWNQADSGYFVNRTLTGDFDVRARIDQLQNTNPWAKAGVMIRESANAGARYAAALLTADNAAGFQFRPVAGGDSGFTFGPWVHAPYWTRVVRTGDLFEGYISPDGINWTLLGNTTLALPAQVIAGIAVSSHDVSRPTHVEVSQLTFGGSNPPPPPPPGDWTPAAIGTGGGNVTVSGGTVTIGGRGADFWNQADAGELASRLWHGDGEFTVRLDSLSEGNAWSKAGLMLRADLSPGSINALVSITPHNGAVFAARSSGNASTALVQQDWLPGAPVWLKLTRTGATITAAYSINGTTWTPLGSTSVAMGADIYVALAVSSHDSGATSNAVFSNYSAH